MKALTKRTFAAAGVFALALSGALLAGCSSSNTDQEILDKLNQMETEIAELKGSQTSSGDQSADTAANDQSASAATSDPAADSSANVAGSDIEATLADLESRAAAAVETADAVAVPQDASARPQAYFDAKAPLETLEHEADQLEDQLEMQYRQGSLDRDAFWGYDQRVSAIEDSLDDAADRLELRMGVDD